MLLEENENVFLLKTDILLNLREQHTLLVSQFFLAFLMLKFGSSSLKQRKQTDMGPKAGIEK